MGGEGSAWGACMSDHEWVKGVQGGAGGACMEAHMERCMGTYMVVHE